MPTSQLNIGITECLKTYSGGLGVLSGDHLKSSSDLGLPLVGIGLAYHYGFFTQVINREGWQTENYELNEFQHLPISLLRDENYLPVKISVNFPNRTIWIQVWVANVGRVKLFLLDTFIAENAIDDRRITDILYGGDNEKRICQEIILGMAEQDCLRSWAMISKHFISMKVTRHSFVLRELKII